MSMFARSVVAAILTTALAAATAACGGSAGTADQGSTATATATPTASASPASKASADPLAGLTGQRILTRAFADTESAASVRLTGVVGDSGQAVTMDLTVVAGKGCDGTLTVAKTGSFRLIYNGTTVWILPDEAFYRSQGTTAAVLAILEGKYLKVSGKGSGLGAMAGLCSLSSLLSGFRSTPADYPRGGATKVDGQRAVRISDTGDSAYVDVSDTVNPELLRMYAPGSSGLQLDFRYAAAPAITGPPAGMVLDGSKYGF
jgi:hypothetical protein